MEWIFALSALASAFSAVLAWAAKLWWSKEHVNAKDEIIKAKDAQIDALNKQIASLNELTPMKIREYFISVKTQLEEYNESLKHDLDKAQGIIADKESLIQKLQIDGEQHNAKYEILNKEKQEILKEVESLKLQLKRLSELYKSAEMVLKISDTPFIRASNLKGAIKSFLQGSYFMTTKVNRTDSLDIDLVLINNASNDNKTDEEN